jgi:hypothetical protein
LPAAYLGLGRRARIDLAINPAISDAGDPHPDEIRDSP